MAKVIVVPMISISPQGAFSRHVLESLERVQCWRILRRSQRQKLNFAKRFDHRSHRLGLRWSCGRESQLHRFDELWAYTSEGARRLWDEMVPVPTRKVSGRLTVTYAGFEGESVLLE